MRPSSTVLSSYSPSYPPLVEDFSYGVRMDATFVRLVGGDTPTLVRVPDAGDSGVASSLAWTRVNFDDGGWREGVPGVGYDNNTDYDAFIGTEIGSQMRNVNTSAWIRIPFTVDDPSELETLERAGS